MCVCVCRCPLSLKWPRLGRTGFLFLIVLSLKHFFYFIYFFFTKYHFSSHFFPYSTGVAHPQVGLGSGQEWGYWSEKVQDVGRGAGLSTMRARLEPRAGGDGRAKPGHILGRREGPGVGLPKRQEG